MIFEDNRQFIEVLAKTGDVVRVKRTVDWDLEAGAIVARANEAKGPAVLFEQIKDYPSGYRLFGSPLGTYRRLAIALGLDADTSPKTLQNEFERRTESPIRPVVVKDAPCKQNVLLREEVDLYRFPAPMVHDGDGGRYIGTWHMVIMKDPDSDWVNWGMYRLMVHNKNHVGVYLTLANPNQGARLFFRHYFPNREPMPVAIAIGADPLSSFAAACRFRARQSEVDYAGGLRGKPVELVKCETNDLLVPAHSEVILEGMILPTIVDEGPFGEALGYRHGMERFPVMRVDAITYRDNPMLTMTCMGMPVHDSHIVESISGSVNIKKRLRSEGIPVQDVFLPPEMSLYAAVISVQGSGSNLQEQLAETVMGDLKFLVVNDDVDVFDLNQVLHAFATKCHPGTGISVVEHQHAALLSPFLTKGERATGKGARVIFDCTWPPGWSRETDTPMRCSFKDVYPEEIRERVLRNWMDDGFR